MNKKVRAFLKAIGWSDHAIAAWMRLSVPQRTPDMMTALGATKDQVALAMAPERHASGGIGSVIDFPAERGEPSPLPDGGPFTHSDDLDAEEPNSNAVDLQALPRIAFAEMGVDGNRTTWGYAHHWVKGATKKDGMGALADGKMFLHKGLLEQQLGHADMMHLESPARDHLEAHAKAHGLRLPWVDSFNAGASAAQGAKHDPDEIALAANQGGRKLHVDFDKGIIYDVTFMSKGAVRPASDGGVDPDAHVADDVTLAQACEGVNATAEGIKSHVTHSFLEAAPGTLKDAILRLVGRIRNARVVGNDARGDVHVHLAAAKSPSGNLRDWLLALADEDPKSIGLSAIFRPDKAASRRDGALRIAAVKAIDFVDDAGSTNDGLLSAGPGAASQPGTVHGGKEKSMNPKLRAYLEKIGLKSGATEAEANVYLAGLTGDQKSGADAIAAGKDVVVALASPAPAPQKSGDVALTAEQAVAQDRQYRKDLIALAKDAGIADVAIADGWYERHVSLAQARELALVIKTSAPNQLVTVTRDAAADKVVALAEGVKRAVRIRAGSKVEAPKQGDLVACQSAEVAGRLVGLSSVEMARRFFDGLGVPDAMYLSQSDTADLMIGGTRALRNKYGSLVALGAGGESTSDFPSLLLDAINKTLRQAYLDRPVTWPKFCKKNTARDFKNIYSIAMSEFPDLLAENEMAEYKDVQVNDAKETYALGVFRAGATISWKTFVNDDLSAFNRLPLEMATAARRKEEDVAYLPLTSNQMMADGYSLFSSQHSNIASGSTPVTGAGGVPSVTTMGACETLMIKQKGPKGAARLEIKPAIVLVPAGLKVITEQLLHSTWDPASSAFQRFNPYTRMSMEYNTRLDDSSAAYWYVLADLADPIVGIEIAFLESQEGPVLKQEVAFRTDDIRFAIRHVVAAHAIDYRAFVRNNGA